MRFPFACIIIHVNRIGVSTWTLHRALKETFPNAPASLTTRGTAAKGTGEQTLPEVLEDVLELGYEHVELCHFHMAFGDKSPRMVLAKHGLRLGCLLIDEGDWTHPETGDRDAAWIAEWAKFAVDLGAQRIRVIGGKTRTDDAIKVTAERFAALHQAVPGIEISTENWFDVLANPDDVIEVFAQVPELKLCFDFGNWNGADKYDRLAAIAHLATYSHAKCDFLPGTNKIAAEDYDKCLQILAAVDYQGPYTAVNGGEGDPWKALAATAEYLDKRI